MDFYVTIVNKELQCELPKEIDVSRYEVALSEIKIPEQRYITFKGARIKALKNNKVHMTMTIPPGHYFPWSLLHTIQEVTDIKSEFDSRNFSITLTCPESMTFEFPDSLVDILGLKTKTIEGEVKGIMHLTETYMFVCGDFVCPQFVNNTTIPLLGIFPRSVSQSNREYVGITKSHLRDIKLSIIDTDMKKVEFIKCEVLIRLHFRRINK